MCVGLADWFARPSLVGDCSLFALDRVRAPFIFSSVACSCMFRSVIATIFVIRKKA